MESGYRFYLSGEKYGIMKDSKVIIPAIYEAVTKPLSSHTKVWRDGNAGYIDESGIEILPCRYADAYHLWSDFYAVRMDNGSGEVQFGVINKEGIKCIDFAYKYITFAGAFVLCYKEADIHSYSNYIGGSKYYYDGTGNCVVYNKSFEVIYEGNVWVSQGNYLIIPTNDGDFMNAIDETGTKIFSDDYDYIRCIADDLFIIRKTHGDTWNFAVIKRDGTNIIEDKYKYIEACGNFFKCYKVAECHREFAPKYDRYSYEDYSDLEWKNQKGIDIFKGKGMLIFDNILAINRDRRWGIVDENGKRIANALYDNVYAVADRIAIVRDKKVGILYPDGTIFLDAVYDSIESVNIGVDGRPQGWERSITPGSYSRKLNFDTEDEKFKIVRCCLPSLSGQDFLYRFDFEKPLILRKGDSCELYMGNGGFVKNSKFDLISPLTNLSYCVKRDGRYGVFRIDGEQLIIPCDYDQIQFEGEHTVLLRKGELWGARDLFLPTQEDCKAKWGVTIEPSFFSIKILDKDESLFSVEIEDKNYKDIVERKFTIYSRLGKELDTFSYNGKYDAHFTLYSQARILTKYGDKFGFVNLRNQNTIPFIYDKVELRDDGYFDICIGKAWGVLSLYGRELLPVRYSDKIKIDGDFIKVTDYRSGKQGVISKDFVEIAPCIFDHIIIDTKDKLIYFGYGGYDTGGSNFFSDGIEHAKWGCMSLQGKILISAIYDCYKIFEGHILAGRDGGFLLRGQDDYYPEYGGLYDLYDINGKLLFGGFDKCEFKAKSNLWFFQLGGEWKQECEDYDEDGNAIYYYDYKYIGNKSKWLVLNNEMTSIIPRSDGSLVKLGVGFIHHIRVEKKEEKTISYWSLPSFEITSIEKPYFEYNALICKQDGKKFAVLLPELYRTKCYDRLSFYAPDKYFCCNIDDMDTHGVMITRITKDADGNIKEDDCYLAAEESGGILTIPQNGYFFRVSDLDENLCRVDLLQEDNHCDVIEVISSCDKWKLCKLIAEGLLMIRFDGNGTDIKNIVLPHDEIFEPSFIQLISDQKGNFVPVKKCDTYWFENGDYNLNEYKEDDYSYNDRDSYEDDYISPLEAFEGDVDLYNEWLLNS